MDALLLSGSLFLVFLLLSACGEGPADPPAASPAPHGRDATWRGEGVEIEVAVSPIHCQGCELAIEEALGEIDGVLTVEADHSSKKVRVVLEGPDARDAVIGKIRDAIHAQKRLVVGEDEIPAAD